MDININSYSSYKYENVSGRYLSSDDIETFLADTTIKGYSKKVIGTSVNNKPIYLLTTGTGPLKVFMWSQMHGNESTTTKAVLDMLTYFSKNTNSTILSNLTLYIIPMLNPDGANAYTRFNANNVDLNRDASNLIEPESKVLRQAFEDIKPHFCFNLHDQRTIFSVGNTPQPATVSFLAPAEDEATTITPTREKAMQVISIMINELNKYIPNQIGRFDDSFNINCVGDMFTYLGVPTILFEAGHYPNDYEREETRKYIFLSLMSALNAIATQKIDGTNYSTYLNVPENEKRFFDILIKNVAFEGEELENENEIGVLFKENLQNNNIFLFPYVEKIGNLQNAFGHKTIDASKLSIKLTKEEVLTGNIEDILRKL